MAEDKMYQISEEKLKRLIMAIAIVDDCIRNSPLRAMLGNHSAMVELRAAAEQVRKEAYDL